MHLYSEYFNIFAALERYSGLRKAFRRKKDRDEEEHEILAMNIVKHLNFVIDTSSEIKREAKEAQHLLYVKAERYFGNGEFLRLTDD